MRALALVLLLATTMGPAIGQERPRNGQLSNTKETNSLYFECGYSTGPSLSCRFNQFMVSTTKPLTEEQISAEVESAMSNLPDEKTCQQMKDINEQIKAAETAGNLSADDLESVRELTPFLLSLCSNPSPETVRALVKFKSDRKAKTCNLWGLPFDLTFSWNTDTTRWESLSSPNGPCGVVTYAYMEKDGDYFWNYGQQKVVTNRGGEDPLLGKCSEYPAEESHFQWQARTIHAQCEYVTFSLF